MTGGTAAGHRKWLALANAHFERFAIITFYIYIIFIVVLEVFRRYVLNYSSLWGSQTAMYIFIYMSWVGMSWAAYKRVHIRMSILYEFVSDRTRTYLYIFSDLTMILFGLLTAWYVYESVLTSLEFSRNIAVMKINQSVFEVAIVIGMLLFVVRTLQRLYGDVRALRRNEAPFAGERLFELGEE